MTGVAGMLIGRWIALKVNLVDSPGGRKNHKGNIPLIGGLVIYAIMLFGVLLSPATSKVSIYILLLSGPVLLVGLFDDLLSVDWRLRLVVQALSCLGVILTTGLYVKNLGSFMWIVDAELGPFGIPFTIFAVVGLTNAFNMIDGHDGFAGFAVLAAVFGMMLFGGSNHPSDPMMTYLALGIAVFLFFNLNGNQNLKVFLGDAGSTFLGFVVAWLLISSSQGSSAFMPIEGVLWCIAIPAVDLLRVMMARIWAGQNVFMADQSHLHHVLARNLLYKSAPIAVFLFLCFASILIGYLIVLNAPALSTIAFTALGGIYTLCLKNR